MRLCLTASPFSPRTIKILFPVRASSSSDHASCTTKNQPRILYPKSVLQKTQSSHQRSITLASGLSEYFSTHSHWSTPLKWWCLLVSCLKCPLHLVTNLFSIQLSVLEPSMVLMEHSRSIRVLLSPNVLLMMRMEPTFSAASRLCLRSHGCGWWIHHLMLRSELSGNERWGGRLWWKWTRRWKSTPSFILGKGCLWGWPTQGLVMVEFFDYVAFSKINSIEFVMSVIPQKLTIMVSGSRVFC